MVTCRVLMRCDLRAKMSQTASVPSACATDDDGVFTRQVSLQRQDSSADHVHHSWHPATLLEQLNAMRMEGGLTDVCLQSDDGQRFPCHRAILAATFPYFRAMFTGGMGEVNADQVQLHNIPGSILGQFVDYCYTGSLLLTVDTVKAVFDAANFLQLSAIENECEHFLQDRLNAQNSLEMERVANRLFNRQLSAQAHSYSVGNFTESTFSQDFLEFSPEQMTDFISKDVGVDSEEEVYEAVMRWVYHDKEERKGALVSLFENVLFEVMSEAYVLEIAAKEKLLQEQGDCMKIVKKALSFHGANAKAVLIGNTLLCCSPLHSKAQSMRNYSEVMILIGHLEFRYRMQGGHSKASNLLMYNPKHQTWDELPGSPFGSGGVEFSTAATVVDNDILVSTNQHRAWLYLTRQNKWSLLTNRMEGRNGGCLVSLDNRAFILGGLKPIETTRLTSVQSFNPVSKQWLDVAPMDQGLVHTTAATCLGKIYVIGSTSGTRTVSEMFCYSPVNDNWVDCTPLPSRLMRPKMVAVDGSLYILGHLSDFDMAMLCYNVKSGKWTSVDAPMIARHGATFAVCNNKLFLLGGKVRSSDYSEVEEFTIECYDPESQIWSIHGEAPWILNGHHTVSVLNPAFPPSRFLGPKQH